MNLPAPRMETAGVFLALARHQLRREQGVPTISVLIGPAENAVAIWREWLTLDPATGWKPVISGEDGGRESPEPAESLAEDALRNAVLHVAAGKIDAIAENEGRLDKSSLPKLVGQLCRALDVSGAEQIARPVGLTVDEAQAAAYLKGERYHRDHTMFAEGAIYLPPEKAGAVIRTHLPGEPADSGTLVKNNVRPETLASLETARMSLQEAKSPTGDPEAGDRARSAAERFLFDLLTDLPETAGVFELNGKLDFCFGPMLAEVDLLARSLHLAVEIDGFHHFREPEGYRRDRRKDAVLQRQNYFVLRFLAEDVVVRLEEILEEIRVTVAFRQLTADAGPEKFV